MRDACGFHGHATRRPESADGALIGPEMVLGLGKDATLQTPANAHSPELPLQFREELAHVTTDSTARANDFHSSLSRASSARPRRVSR